MPSLIHLRESIQDWGDAKDIVITRIPLAEKVEKITLFEQAMKVFSAFIVPIWRLDKQNLNKRIYSTDLANKVISENKVTGALDGHPEDDYVPLLSDIKAVGKTPFIKNGVLYCSCYIIDKDLSDKVESMLELGFPVGLSSSAFGSLDKDGKVEIDSFELERYFDFVLDPSYSVFMDSQSKINTVNESVQETIEDKEIKQINILKEKEITRMSEDTLKMTEQDIRSIRKNVNRSLSKIKNLPLSEQVEELDAIVANVDAIRESSLRDELHEAVEVERVRVSKSLEENEVALAEVSKEKTTALKSLDEAQAKIKEIETELETKIKESETISKKFELACKVMDEAKETYNKLKALYSKKVKESEALIDPKDIIALVKENKELTEQLEKACAMLDSFRKVVRENKIDLSLFEAEDDEEKKDDEEDKEDSEEKSESKKKKEAKKKKKEADDEDGEDEEDLTEAEDDEESDEDEDDEEKSESKKKKEACKSKKKEEDDDEEMDLEDDDDEDEIAEKKTKKKETKKKKEEDDTEDDEEDELEEAEGDDEKDSDEDEKDMEEKKKKKEASKRVFCKQEFTNSRFVEEFNRVKDYYDNLEGIYGDSIKPYQKQFLESGTVTNAQHVFFKVKRFLTLKEDVIPADNDDDLKGLKEAKTSSSKPKSFVKRQTARTINGWL